MVIEAFILCFNEEKMIEHTLNYYSTFCDKINVIDNQSTDQSIQIVEEKFPNVNVIELDTDGEYREDVQIHIRNTCWKNSEADYVIMCDMDEFLYDENLSLKLKMLKEKNITIPVVSGYNMVSDSFPQNYKTSIVNQVVNGVRDRTFDKSIIFSPKDIVSMNFGPGSHYCHPELIESKTDPLLEFKLLHFKYIGKKYLYDKHESYSSRMSEINKKNKFGFEYDLGKEHIDKVYKNLNNYKYKVV